MVELALPAVLAIATQWSARIAAVAVAVNAIEMLSLRSAFGVRGVWRDETLSASWGVFGAVLRAERFRLLLAGQLLAAVGLLALAGTRAGGVCAVLCGISTVLCAMRFRGTVNGGSDGMLFTVLVGLSLTQLAPEGSMVGEAGMLYVGAQLALSYLRAGWVKLRELGWWNGRSMAAFLSLPAYGTPMWVPRQRRVLQLAGMGVVLFECLAPFALQSPRSSVLFIGFALCFHAAVAVVFGLNRFLLAWGAALPTLWYLAHRVG